MALQEFMTGEVKRKVGKMVFEEALTGLTEYGLINSWTKVKPGSEERKDGAHYLIETDHGCVPMAVYLRHFVAQTHRQTLSFPVVSLRSQKTGGFKQKEAILADVSKKIVHYLIDNKMVTSPTPAAK